MKRLAIFMAACATLLAAHAQNIFNNPDNRPYWGIRVSADINMPGDWHFDNGNRIDMFRIGTGVHAGAIFNVPIVANFFFEPGAGIYYDNYRFDNLILTDAAGETQEHDPKVCKVGVRVPLRLGYRFDVSPNASIALFTGPELNYSFWGEIEVKNKELTEGMEDAFDLFGPEGQKRLNTAWNIGASIEWDFNWVLVLNGSLGITDLHKGDAKFRENRISLTLGYNF